MPFDVTGNWTMSHDLTRMGSSHVTGVKQSLSFCNNSGSRSKVSIVLQISNSTYFMWKIVFWMSSNVSCSSIWFDPVTSNWYLLLLEYKKYTVFAVRYTICSPLLMTFKWCSKEGTESRLWRRANSTALWCLAWCWVEYQTHKLPILYCNTGSSSLGIVIYTQWDSYS